MSDIQYEIKFFDKHAESFLKLSPEELVVNDPYSYLAGTKVAFDYMVDRVGDIDGKIILDVGCGCGWLSAYLALHGAGSVYGFDVSSKMIEVAKKRACANNIAGKVHFEQNMAEKIEFDDKFFDIIVGISVLHHIDIQSFGKIMAKMLKGGGKAIFIEPLGESKLGEFCRNKIISSLFSARTENEEPLKFASMDRLEEEFIVSHKEFQLLGSLARYIGDRAASLLGLNITDLFLLKSFSFLNRQCRLTVLELTHK